MLPISRIEVFEIDLDGKKSCPRLLCTTVKAQVVCRLTRCDGLVTAYIPTMQARAVLRSAIAMRRQTHSVWSLEEANVGAFPQLCWRAIFRPEGRPVISRNEYQYNYQYTQQKLELLPHKNNVNHARLSERRQNFGSFLDRTSAGIYDMPAAALERSDFIPSV